MNYDEYVANKKLEQPPSGFSVDPADLHPQLFDYQRVITRWALHRGKAALFEDCGLGKSFQEWEWGKHVAQQTNLPVLIVAPLSVSEQMLDEAPTFGYTITSCDSRTDLRPGLNVTNYEKLSKFSPEDLGGLILDESSILKAGTFGKLSTELVKFAESIPYRLAATATPAPNDLVELAFHAEFLGVMQESEIKALFFTQDGNSSNKFRLKRNAVEAFYKWLATWAVALRKPSDLGFSDEGFQLPELHIEQIVIDDGSTEFEDGTLFGLNKEAHGLSEQRNARYESLMKRVNAVAEPVNSSTAQWLIWCDLNPESEALAKVVHNAIEVKGSDKPAHKLDAMRGFRDGRYQHVISKPQMWGFGMNFQHAHHMAFCGLGNSFERYYQSIKRQHRFGQKASRVTVYVFTTPADGAVVKNILRKWAQNDAMFDELVKHMAVHADFTVASERQEMAYIPQKSLHLPAWLNSIQAVRKTLAVDDVYRMAHIDLGAMPFQIAEQLRSYWHGAYQPRQAMQLPTFLSEVNYV